MDKNACVIIADELDQKMLGWVSLLVSKSQVWGIWTELTTIKLVIYLTTIKNCIFKDIYAEIIVSVSSIGASSTKPESTFEKSSSF